MGRGLPIEYHGLGQPRPQAALRATGRTNPRVTPGLTPREEHLANLAAKGLSNKAIAVVLQRTERGIKSSMARLYAKLGISNKHNARMALLLRQLNRASVEAPSCERCVFRGFARFSQEISSQLLTGRAADAL